MGSAWIHPDLHSPHCTQNSGDTNTLYIRETINGKQQFIPMGAYCRCCGAFDVYPQWEHKNNQKFEIVKRRIPREYTINYDDDPDKKKEQYKINN
ncbi:MAG TPA: hypothetical protein VLA74_03890 [Nitrososphaeraceae archaeon]|nr:hypothetical protein [Nitrososphaeraceae archaeon]